MKHVVGFLEMVNLVWTANNVDSVIIGVFISEVALWKSAAVIDVSDEQVDAATT